MKKGQAAMEFLMTYGWAILIVLLAIAALAYFGVLGPGKYIPSSCVLETGLASTDFKVVGGVDSQITIYVRNGMGQDLRNFTLQVPGECNATSTNLPVFKDGAEAKVTINCGSDILGSRIKENILINYFSPNGMQHTKLGSISARVEE